MTPPHSQPNGGDERHTAYGTGSASTEDALEMVVLGDGTIDVDATMRAFKRRVRRQFYYLPLPGRRRLMRHVRALVVEASARAPDQGA